MPSLYDASLRQQLFLEGLKNNQALEVTDVVTNMFIHYVEALQKLEGDSIVMGKQVFQSFLAGLRSKAIGEYTPYTVNYMNFLEQFVAVETNYTVLTFKQTGAELPKNPPLRNFGRKFSSNAWSKISKSDISGVGDLLPNYIDDLGSGIIGGLEKLIKVNYLDNGSIKELLDKIKNKKGGLYGTYVNRARQMVNTSIQHVSAQTKDKVQAEFFDKYKWVSIMDASTTQICSSRNNKVFRYDDGPLPPAHPGCRSITVPVYANMPDTLDTFEEWFSKQDDRLKRKLIGSSDEPVDKFKSSLNLTLSGYKATIPIAIQ